MSKLSRQRLWQLRNSEKARLLRVQTATRRRYSLLVAGIVKTHEELYDILTGYESRHGKFNGKEWWDAYEYLDWKYNNCAFTDLAFSRKLETVWGGAK